MKTKQQFEKIIAEAQAGIAELDKVVVVWVPKQGEIVFYINYYSQVQEHKWQGLTIDLTLHESANLYPTQEAAEQARDRQLATVKVVRRIAELDAIAGWKPDWGRSMQDKYVLQWDYTGRLVDYSIRNYIQQSPAEWYGSKETINTVIKELPEEIKLMLGVSND